MSDPNNTGMFPKKMWIEIWDRAYYGISVGEIERELAQLPDDPPQWDKWKRPRLQEVLAEHKALLAEARQALKPYMRRKMIRGGLEVSA